MSVAVANSLIEVIDYLRPGAVYRDDHVTWEEYEQLLEDLGPSYSVRIFYDQGRMEIMSPLPAHEKPVKVLHRLITAISDELDIDIESLGSSTLKKELKDKGAEPDDCFYVQHAAQMIGRTDLDLHLDPPPDIAIESDLTSSSLDRFAIYAGLGVPELWRISNQYVRLWLLEAEEYKTSETSLAFPFLTATALNEHLVLGLTEGERKAARAFRTWIRAHLPVA